MTRKSGKGALLWRAVDLAPHMTRVAAAMRLVAAGGTTNGREDLRNRLYLGACRQADRRTGTILIFSRDTEHHTSGFLKNPDYERCLHLSLSFFDPATGRPRDFDRKLADQWARAFFGDDVRLAWVESPKSPEGRSIGVWHWRLFCDAQWVPLLPRGEVYSTEFTELGWRSASQVLEEEGRRIESPVDPS